MEILSYLWNASCSQTTHTLTLRHPPSHQGFRALLWFFLLDWSLKILAKFICLSQFIQEFTLSVLCLFYLATNVWFLAEEDFQGFRDVPPLLQSSTLSLSRECVARQLWEPSDRVQTVVLCLQRVYCLCLYLCLIGSMSLVLEKW